MAIDKMTFIDITGDADYLDEVLIRCARCGVFQPENAHRLSEYSVGKVPLESNPYGALLLQIGEIASALGVEPAYRECAGSTESLPSPDAYVESTRAYLSKLQAEYPGYLDQQKWAADQIASYTAALETLSHVDAPDLDFDRLWQNKFLQVRFGRLPTTGLQKLDGQGGPPFEIYKLESSAGTTWCLYVTADKYRDEVDDLFRSAGFERLRIPEFVHGTAEDAVAFIQEGLVEERERLRLSLDRMSAFVDRERATFLQTYTRVKFLHEAYELRRQAVLLHGQFHVVGHVLTRNLSDFVQLFHQLPTVEVRHEPAAADGPVPVPVQLKNNWFARPFEMFVNMYGSPSYNDIDPTPFVAVTYSLLFGMMYGDVGHGLCVFLLGNLLWRLKGMALGRIMSRIGCVSMAFGFLYGSVFGFEHLLDPVFSAMGFSEKPIQVMRPDTTNKILIAAIAIGAAVIVMVIIFNICVGLRRRDIDRVLLSHNGLAGLVFYVSVLYAAVRSLGGGSVLSRPYALCLIVLPLAVIFFREPIAGYLRYRGRDTIIHSDQDLEESVRFHEGEVDFPALFCSRFVVARFGRLPTDSYKKLSYYSEEPFLIYPLKTDRDYIWCIYTTAAASKKEIDAIFHDLFFERIYIPAESLGTNDEAEAFIRGCIEAGADHEAVISSGKYGEVTVSRPKTALQTMFPAGVGGFLTETFFELFEVVLSFITNTMSFLRVGGFILVHAGMMEVVFQLSGMVGAGAGPVIIVVGNIFVMAMEGLIVGIQVLRLQFYEIFSRFFDAAGEPFTPYRVEYGGSPSP